MSEEIDKLFDEDQKDRVNYPMQDGDQRIAEINRRDEERLSQAKELVRVVHNLSAEELHKLSFIFQHGNSVDDYREALELARMAVDRGMPGDKTLLRQATDRLIIQLQMNQGVEITDLVQKYGTQTFITEGREFVPRVDQSLEISDFERE